MKNILKTIGLLACVVALAACSSKLTNENLQKVKVGMSEAQVQEILGRPSQVESGETLGIRGTNYNYEKSGSKVQIIFVNDSVINKSGSFK